MYIPLGADDAQFFRTVRNRIFTIGSSIYLSKISVQIPSCAIERLESIIAVCWSYVLCLQNLQRMKVFSIYSAFYETLLPFPITNVSS